MGKAKQKQLCVAAILFAAFFFWTLIVRFIDVQPIGPNNTTVGLATLNGYFHNRIGRNLSLYILTDWLGLIPIATMFGFFLCGLVQWIKRKKLLLVDRSLFVLGGLYVLVFAAYLFFESVIINYRPVLLDGRLEASYPSSTTLLVLTVVPPAAVRLCACIKHRAGKGCIAVISVAFIAFMVFARLFSGVHWFTDIIGGVLLSAALVVFDRFVDTKC